MKCFAGIIALFFLVLCAPYGRPESSNDESSCEYASDSAKPPKDVIAACSRLIRSGKTRGKDLAELYAKRGDAYESVKDFKHAIADYGKAIELDSTNVDHFNDRAMALLKTKQARKALADAERAVQLDPNNADVADTRAQVYEALGRKLEASAEYTRALRLDPSIEESQKSHLRLATETKPPDDARPGVTVQPNVGSLRVDGADAQFAPNGKILAVNEGIQIKLWDIMTGRPLRVLEHFALFQEFTFIQDGEKILSAHKDGYLRVWDTPSGKLLESKQLHEKGESVSSMWHDPSRKLVVIAFQDGVVVWDYARQQSIADIPFAGYKWHEIIAEDARLSADGSQVIAGWGRWEGGTQKSIVTFIDLKTKKMTRKVDIKKDHWIFQGSILNDRTLLIKTNTNDCDAALLLVDLSTSEPIYETIDPAPGCKRKPDGSVDDKGHLSILNREVERRLYVARGGKPGIKVWDVADRRLVDTIKWLPADAGPLLAIDANGSSVALTAENNSLLIASLTNGHKLATLRTFGQDAEHVIVSHDGRKILMHKHYAGEERFAIWPIDGVAPSFRKVRLPEGFSVWDVSVEADLALTFNKKGAFGVYSIDSGSEIAAFSLPDIQDLWAARLSPDGSKVLVLGLPEEPKEDRLFHCYLVDLKTGAPVLTFAERKSENKEAVTSFTFSEDGRMFALGFRRWTRSSMSTNLPEGWAEIWSTDSRKLLKRLQKAGDQTKNLTFSPDKKFLIGGSRDSGVFVWSTETGKLLRELERRSVAGHVNTGGLAVSEDNELIAVGPQQRAVSSGDTGRERGVQVWDLATGNFRFALRGHEDDVTALLFSSDKRWIVSGSGDGTIRYWNRQSGELAATFATSLDGQWVILTGKGFFAASSDAGNLLSVVRGFQAVSIDQLWQSLYDPDLVREFLAGDPNGEVKAAEFNADLPIILDSGPSPTVEITSHPSASSSGSDIVKVAARFTDGGKSVGRIEWRVNGVTAAIGRKPLGIGPDYNLSQQLALDPGENSIEVVAYNGSNLLASLPARTTITFTGPADAVRPKLHVLTVGINSYVDKGWLERGRIRRGFPQLTLAVKDAESFGAEMKRANTSLYQDVIVTPVLDKDATRDNIDKVVEKIAKDINPRDTFILFAAAHGTSENGRFYLIPQDYQGGPGALQQQAIGQDQLQDWLANRIKAKKALILLDTCESGALVAGYLRSRTEEAASEAGVGRLHEATGRPVLTAAAIGQFAHEGVVTSSGERHGIFTWALLEALHNGDTNGNGKIELSELVAYVQSEVPKLAAKYGGTARAETATPRREGQAPRFGSRGEDFAIVDRLR